MNYLKQHGNRIIRLSYAFIGITVLILWGWNNSITYLLGLPMMEFKHATGLIVLMGSITFLLGWSRERSRTSRNPFHPDSVSEKE